MLTKYLFWSNIYFWMIGIIKINQRKIDMAEDNATTFSRVLQKYFWDKYLDASVKQFHI